jgi:adenylate cyclase
LSVLAKVSESSEFVTARARERIERFLLPASGALHPWPWAVAAAVGGAMGLALSFTDTAQRLEWATYDRLLRAVTSRNAPAPGIVLVAIDEPSATELGRPWPWPRAWHARLIDQLTRGGARAIVLDIVFEGPGADPAGDADLVRAVREAGNVVIASDLVETADRSYDLAQWVEPFAELGTAAAAVGAARVTPDPDGVVRRVALATAGRPGLGATAARIVGSPLPPDSEHLRLIAFNGPPRMGVRTVSYYQAIDADSLLPRELFRDAVVFVGRALSIVPADTDVPDHYATPVGLRTPGVEIHASVFDTLVREREVRDPLGDGRWLAVVLLAVGLSGGMALRAVTPGRGLAAVAAAAVALLAIAWWGLGLATPLRVPVLGPVVTLVAAYATTSAYRYAVGARERRTIRRAFQHYVSPAVVELLLRDPSRLKLGGEDCTVTVLFSDLQGFTAFSEHLGPEQVRARLSEHFTEMVEALLAERATLDKFIGDSVMAYFGAPLPDPDHAGHACRAALAMQARMAALSTTWMAGGMPRVRVRIGLNTGPVVAGNMGTASVFNYTVIGDTVNLASRLEGVNKAYGTGIIVGERTRAGAGDRFVFRELDAIRVQGRAQPVAIHELVGLAGAVDAVGLDVIRAYEEGLVHYRAQQWAAARAAFARASALDPQDGPSTVMLRRTLEFAAAPPGDDWDGVCGMRSK